MRYHLSALAAGLAVAFAILSANPSDAAPDRNGLVAAEIEMNGGQQCRSGSSQG